MIRRLRLDALPCLCGISIVIEDGSARPWA